MGRVVHERGLGRGVWEGVVAHCQAGGKVSKEIIRIKLN
jgi:hypothetical protein